MNTSNTHQIFTCLKSTIETEEKGVAAENVKDVKFNNKDTRTISMMLFWT